MIDDLTLSMQEARKAGLLDGLTKEQIQDRANRRASRNRGDGSANKGRVLLIVNGGLGDAVAITYPAIAALRAGYSVDVWAIAGNATKMAPVWRELGLGVVDRSTAAATIYNVICCNCAASALQTRCKGFAALEHGAALRVPGRPHGTLVEEAMRLVPGLPTPDAPLASLRGKQERRAIVLGPGVGRPQANQSKRWDHWQDVLNYWPRPVEILGDDKAREPWIQELAEKDQGINDRLGCSIQDAISIFASARVYVGPDNGLGHLAAACGVPCITMFTATDHRFRPHGDHRNILLDSRNGDHVGDVVNALHRLVARDLWKLPAASTSDLLLSVVIGTHNEGVEVFQTIQDVVLNAGCRTEIIVVDDGSTDSSCVGLAQRHQELDPLHASTIKVLYLDGDRRGVAPARNAGAAVATGDVLMFLDAHMRVAPGTPALMANQAHEHQAVIIPGMAPLYSTRGANWKAYYRNYKGYINAEWRKSRPRAELEPTDAWVGPGWAISAFAWAKIGPWPSQARNWGSTEIAMSVAANIAGVPILASRDAITWHRFRSRFPYEGVRDHDKMANAYIIARAIIDDDDLVNRMRHGDGTKQGYWRDEFQQIFDSPEFQELRAKWAKIRTMSGREFMRRFLDQVEPEPPAGTDPTPDQTVLINRLLTLETEAAQFRAIIGQDSYQVHSICYDCNDYDRCKGRCRQTHEPVAQMNHCPMLKWLRNKTVSTSFENTVSKQVVPV